MMKSDDYLNYTLHRVDETAKAFSEMAEKHSDEPDVHANCLKFSIWCKKQSTALKSVISESVTAQTNLQGDYSNSFIKLPDVKIDLFNALHNAWLLTGELKLCWIVLIQCAKALRNKTNQIIFEESCKETEQMNEWFLSRIKTSASQVLTVPE